MAGFFTILQSQDFTSTDSITVTHGLNRAQVAIAVRVGDELRNDLIEKVQPGSADPRNEVVVTLTSAQSGTILLLGTDYIFSNTPAPEEAATDRLRSSSGAPGHAGLPAHCVGRAICF